MILCFCSLGKMQPHRLKTIGAPVRILRYVNRVRARARGGTYATDEFREWATAEFSSPAPTRVKRGVLRRWSLHEASWIETGTYK